MPITPPAVLIAGGVVVCSSDLDEIVHRQRSARKLGKLSTDCERSKVDAEEAELLDQRGHVGLQAASVSRLLLGLRRIDLDAASCCGERGLRLCHQAGFGGERL